MEMARGGQQPRAELRPTSRPPRHCKHAVPQLEWHPNRRRIAGRPWIGLCSCFSNQTSYAYICLATTAHSEIVPRGHAWFIIFRRPNIRKREDAEWHRQLLTAAGQAVAMQLEVWTIPHDRSPTSAGTGTSI